MAVPPRLVPVGHRGPGHLWVLALALLAGLPPGEGLELVEAHCLACHSLDYVTTQPPQMGDAFWKATVTKMVDVMKAPIEPSDAEAIAAYLARTH